MELTDVAEEAHFQDYKADYRIQTNTTKALEFLIYYLHSCIIFQIKSEKTGLKCPAFCVQKFCDPEIHFSSLLPVSAEKGWQAQPGDVKLAHASRACPPCLFLPLARIL